MACNHCKDLMDASRALGAAVGVNYRLKNKHQDRTDGIKPLSDALMDFTTSF